MGEQSRFDVFYQDAKRVVELLRNLRRKRLQKLNRRMGDLKYLSSMGLDAKDAQLAKEKAYIENRIAHWDIKLTTAKFLRDKVCNITHPRILFATFNFVLGLTIVKKISSLKAMCKGGMGYHSCSVLLLARRRICNY